MLSGCWCSPQANADPSVISCLHNLSRRIAIVLQHEERRCQYLTREAKLILAIQDEVSAMSESECLSSSASVQEHCLRELLIVPSCFSRAWDHCEQASVFPAFCLSQVHYVYAEMWVLEVK